MSANNSFVATYAKASLAEADIRKLHQAGFDAGALSVIGHGGEAFEGTAAVVGFDGLDAAACRCIPEEDIQAYEAEAEAGRVVLVAHGTADEIARAQSAVASPQPINWNESAGYTVYYGCDD